jgi:hypothetical protein
MMLAALRRWQELPDGSLTQSSEVLTTSPKHLMKLIHDPDVGDARFFAALDWINATPADSNSVLAPLRLQQITGSSLTRLSR